MGAVVALAILGVPSIVTASNAPLNGATGISVGRAHACASIQSGGAMCWSGPYSPSGAIGRTTPGHAAAPVDSLPMVLSSVAAGNDHSCAATSSGALFCFGSNSQGQLGIGDPGIFNTWSPQLVSSLANVTAVAAGYDHTCAIAGGAAFCWGDNDTGEIGDGSQTQRDVPVAVTGLAAGVTRITAGMGHSCAIVNGAAKCWGEGSVGQIGDGTDQQRLVPAQVSGLPAGTSAISAGYWHTCAVVSGAVKCWGINGSGQVGDGTVARRSAPVNVIGAGSGFLAVSAGEQHTCALKLDGTVYCWGANNAGQLGDGTLDSRTVAAPVVGLGAPAVALAAGGDATCVLLNDATVRCFGGNQLGINSLPARIKSIEVAPVASAFASIDGGEAHTCATTVAGTALCWGSNPVGQLGDGTLVPKAFPSPVLDLGGSVSGIATGSLHTCANNAAGAAYCWGSNVAGQLGVGSNSAVSKIPLPVTGLSAGVTQIAASYAHSCAVTSGGVKCWGHNGTGQLGTGNTTSSLVPVDVLNLGASARRIALGNDHTCALRIDGGVKCWGSNWAGQLGDGTLQQRLAPIDVVGLTAGVASIAVGDAHSCSLGVDGGVRCWGNNSAGQLGDNSFVAQRSYANPVVGLSSGALAIAAGAVHSCALVAGGVVRCWGGNGLGQVGENGGDPQLAAYTLIPVDVPLPEPAVAIAAGKYHSCAILASGKARCWGDSSSSQLGNGDARYSAVPRSVVLANFSTSVALSTTPNPSAPGDYVAIVAHVTGSDTVATGSVIFHDNSAVLPCAFNGQAVIAQGEARCTVPMLAGVHTIRAEYLGDNAHFGSSAVTTHYVNSVPGQHCANFDDVDAAHPFCRHVEWIRNRGITLGCAGFDYCPQAAVNRLSMAAFMNRLGKALSPEIFTNPIAYEGNVSLFGSMPICYAATVPAADYPRRGYLDAVLSGAATADGDIDVRVVSEHSGSSFYMDVGSRTFAPALHYTTLRVAQAFDIPAGQSTRFALHVSRSAFSWDYLENTTCATRVMIFNREETHSPFDAPQ